MTKPKLQVAVSRLSDSKWENKGLRGFLEYRDLGVVDGPMALWRQCRALHAKKATDHAALHYHTLGFHRPTSCEAGCARTTTASARLFSRRAIA
jgi:hypothetical protein